MNSECIKPDKLIEEYGEWLKREASAKDLGDWKEITLPMLDECNVFYTASVGIRGVSKYEHSFDFIFQRSVNHPTRFCQAPNKFDKNAVRDIMWGWEDTRKAKERAGARLVVIGDDREGPLQDGALDAFTNCGVIVIPYSKLAERAPQELAA